MDLFTPVVRPEEQHPNFRALMELRSAPNRAVLEKWAEGFKDRDGKFVREFQTTFNSGFWELYIFACCKELDFRVNLSFQSPDFVIDNFLNEFCHCLQLICLIVVKVFCAGEQLFEQCLVVV